MAAMTRRLLAVDAPNLDMVVATLFDRRPTSRERPDYAALLRWFRSRDGTGDAEAAVFLNVKDDSADRVAPWVLWLTQTGFRVFVKPKIGDSDIDEDLTDYILRPAAEVSEVVLVSHDARAFLDVAEDLAEDGVRVTVVAFAEYAGAMVRSRDLHFVDLADIPALFQVPLPPRITLRNLPPQGRWFEPTGPRPAAPLPDTDELDLD